jgi:trigger factor
VLSHNLLPVGQPNVADASPVVAPDGFRFTVTVEVRPEITLKDYVGVDVVFPKVEVSSDEVERSVKARLESHARIEEVTGRPVQAGDLAVVELQAKDDDALVAQEFGTSIRVDGDPYYPGLEALLLGKEVGEEVSAAVSFDGSARNEAVAGRTLQVTAKVVSITGRKVPDLDDALATELGFEGGAGGMRTALEARLRAGRQEMARNQARANLIEAVIGKNPFDVPAAMVEDSLRMLMHELRLQTAMRSGKDPRNISFSEAQVADLRQRSVFAAKAALIIEWVAKQEEIEVEESDIEARYRQLADERGQTVEAVRGWFQKESEAEGLRERVREEKVLDWMLERANIVEPPAPSAPQADQPSPA